MSASETPTLTVDLDIVDRNIDRMQRYCDERGIALRPHIKTHKTAQFARLQIEAGAVGIACQKLGEVEALGMTDVDVLVSFPLVGEEKARRLAELAASTAIAVAADSESSLHDLSGALARAGAEAGVLIDCDTGLGRTGVQSPAAAANLAELVERLPGLRFEGLFTHPTPMRRSWLLAARRAIEGQGQEVRRISVGGTAHAFRTHEVPEATELRAGTYIFGDRACIANGMATAGDCALRVRSTVVSRPTSGKATLDAGSKTLTSDRAAGCDPETSGLVIEYPWARITRLYEEHAVVEFDEANPGPEIGEVVTIIPNHACGAVNLHDCLDVHRSGSRLGRWVINARGRSQ
jgi:D-serine deaminase-like pyridoxal phosphate-dependent protein